MRTFIWVGAAALAIGGGIWYESHCGETAMAQDTDNTAACCVDQERAAEPAIACTINDASVMQARKAETDRLFQAAQETVETESGYKLRFDRTRAEELFRYAQFESDCCAFIEFSVTFKRDHGPVWLELSGSAQAKEIIESMLPK